MKSVFSILALVFGLFFKGNAQSDPTPSKLDILNHVYTVVDNKVTPLEKVLATTKAKIKGFGYGGVSNVLEVSGTTSTVKVQNSKQTFFINTGGNTAPDLTLYKLKVGKKTRSAVLMETNMGGMKDVKGIISLNASKIADGVYKLVPSQPLEPGEYFFQNRSIGGNGLTWDVFVFTYL